MWLPEDMLQEKCVLDDMNQTGSSNIMLVWNSCWPDGVLMGTFICFFITTKMSYILTPLLPLFPKGCQHKSHYNMTAGGNFFSPLTHYFFKWFCRERKNLDTKIAGKRTVQCDVSQRSFSKRLSVSAFIAYREQHTRSRDPSWHGLRVLHLARWGWDLPLGPTSTLPVPRKKRVNFAWHCGTTRLPRVEGLHAGDTPHLCISSYFWLTWEHKDFNTECFGNTVISK